MRHLHKAGGYVVDLQDANARAQAYRLALEQRQREWDRFHAWEESCPEARPEWDLATRITWCAAAWELARQFHPGWVDGSVDWDKIERIKRWRNAVAKLGDHDDRSRRQCGKLCLIPVASGKNWRNTCKVYLTFIPGKM